MRAAEREAIARGCHVAMLSTFSFQAPDFYQRLGYEAFVLLDGCPVGHKKYFLKEILGR